MIPQPIPIEYAQFDNQPRVFSRCNSIWYYTRNIIAILIQLITISFASYEFNSQLNDSDTNGYTIMLNTIFMQLLLFDLVNRSDLLSQVFIISNFTNYNFNNNLHVNFNDDLCTKLVDPAIIEDRKDLMSRTMSILILSRVIIGCIFGIIGFTVFKFKLSIFSIIAYYNFLFLLLYVEIFIIRSKRRDARVMQIRNEQHAERMR